MKQTFKTPYNESKFPELRKEKPNTKPSLTVPDQSMSVQEILTRYAQGLPLGGQRVPVFLGEDDPLQGVDIRTLDLSEQAEVIAEAKNKKESLRKPKYKQKKLIEDEIKDKKESKNDESDNASGQS